MSACPKHQTMLLTAHDPHTRLIPMPIMTLNLVYHYITFKNLKIHTFFMLKSQTSNHTQKLSNSYPNSSQTMYGSCSKPHMTLSKPNSHTHPLKPHISKLHLMPQGQNPSQTIHSLKTDQYDLKTVIEMHLHCQILNEIGL